MADDPSWFWGTGALKYYRSGVDHMQLEENLKLTPAERLEKMQRFQRILEEVKRSRDAGSAGSDKESEPLQWRPRDSA